MKKRTSPGDSWIVEDIKTGNPIVETYNYKKALALADIKPGQVAIWTAQGWLEEFNRRIRTGAA
jgi:hypothetical protein